MFPPQPHSFHPAKSFFVPKKKNFHMFQQDPPWFPFFPRKNISHPSTFHYFPWRPSHPVSPKHLRWLPMRRFSARHRSGKSSSPWVSTLKWFKFPWVIWGTRYTHFRKPPYLRIPDFTYKKTVDSWYIKMILDFECVFFLT